VSEHYDALETRSADARAAALAEALPRMVREAAGIPYYESALAGVDTARITDATALAALPVTRKSGLAERPAPWHR